MQPSVVDTEGNETGVLEILVQLNKRGMECLSQGEFKKAQMFLKEAESTILQVKVPH